MNRLITFFKKLEKNNTTYKDIYEGPLYDQTLQQLVFNPTYWKEDIAFQIERTHKLTLDKACITIRIPCKKLSINSKMDKTIVADFILRRWNNYVKEMNQEIENSGRTDKENGLFYTLEPNNNILPRNITRIEKYLDKDYVAIMILVQWPLNKHDKAMRMTCKMLPRAVKNFIEEFDYEGMEKSLELGGIQSYIRKWLKDNDYITFIANGSILPRGKQSNNPMDNAIPFTSPIENEIEICGIKGMGIKRGVTVITGGGYSGKSTLLDAISAGIYNHYQEDGRELVLTEESAVEIISEEGRAISNIDISPFIRWIPNGSPKYFSTTCASGSTSQGANIIEAINSQSRLLIIDEDRSATNFMIKDEKMRKLIKHEPITPFTQRIRELYEEINVSTILVVGGSGEYLGVADNVILMDDYLASNITKEVNLISDKQEENNILEKAIWKKKRYIEKENFTPYHKNGKKQHLMISEFGILVLGDEKVDIRSLNTNFSLEQCTAVAFMIRYMQLYNNNNIIDLDICIEECIEFVEKNGLEYIFNSSFIDVDRWLEMPRKHEIYAVINRMRNVHLL